MNPNHVHCQSYETITIYPTVTYQTIVGFGGSLAYYEGWVTAHPNKSQIYDALFGELGLDILRLRNAHDYDPGMIDRAAEFVQAAESVRGKPISVLSTSWGPPAYLKSNYDRNNGGSLRYSIVDDQVEFDYAGFAHWWNNSLDEYNAHGIFPDYISIQNEPDWTASYESCRLDPSETITSADTIAGYNEALHAVYDSIHTRSDIPEIIGPETIGIGYNALENYCNPMDLSKISAIAHHLYHGVEENNPYASTSFKKVGDYHPELPHFQTEYSRGDWWSLAGMLYMSLSEENAAAYLYWDLAWDGSGLISLDFPWDKSRWKDPDKGYTRTKEFFAFKQFSAFVHPGWKRIEASASGNNTNVAAFMSPGDDSATMVIINRSLTDNLIFKPAIQAKTIERADIYITSSTEDCEYKGNKSDALITLPPKSIATVSLELTVSTGSAVPVTSIVLRPEMGTIINRLASVQVDALVFPANATDKRLLWEITENGQIAGITQDGLVTANGTEDGILTIRATTTDGSGVFADTFITVTNQIPVTGIVLSAADTVIDENMGSLQIEAKVMPDNASSKDVEWSLAEGNSLASISDSGLLIASGEEDGQVTVRATSAASPEIYGEINVTIQNQSNTINTDRQDELKIWYSNGRICYNVQPADKSRKVYLYTLEGSLVKIIEIQAYSSHGEADISTVPKGVYLVMAGSGRYNQFTKIVVY